MQSEESLLNLFVRPVHDAGIRYFVAGSVAAMYFSEPRLTIDIDIPIFVGPSEAALLPKVFREPDFYCPPSDVLSLEATRDCRGHFNIIHIATGLKADFYPGNRDETFSWAWSHRREVESDAGPILLAPPEYVILWKLIYYKEGGSQKHVRDISRMLSLLKSLEHREYLLNEVAARGLEEAWEEVQPS
jgi:hypothetical protein